MRLYHLIAAVFAASFVSAVSDSDDPGPSSGSSSNVINVPLPKEFTMIPVPDVYLQGSYKPGRSRSGSSSGSEAQPRVKGKKAPRALAKDHKPGEWVFEECRNAPSGYETWHDDNYKRIISPETGDFTWINLDADDITLTEAESRLKSHLDYCRMDMKDREICKERVDQKIAAVSADNDRQMEEFQALQASRPASPGSAISYGSSEDTARPNSVIYRASPPRSSPPNPRSRNVTSPPPPESEIQTQEEAWLEGYNSGQKDQEGRAATNSQAGEYSPDKLGPDGFYHGYDAARRIHYRHDGCGNYQIFRRLLSQPDVEPSPSAPTYTPIQHETASCNPTLTLRLGTAAAPTRRAQAATLTLRLATSAASTPVLRSISRRSPQERATATLTLRLGTPTPLLHSVLDSISTATLTLTISPAAPTIVRAAQSPRSPVSASSGYAAPERPSVSIPGTGRDYRKLLVFGVGGSPP
ncbi:hypothetical protein QBC39DRAFT_341782 [Podospora conica]|nr:hypothetical protein QBC39DRAFT_341782 [Schizothecium conicum]